MLNMASGSVIPLQRVGRQTFTVIRSGTITYVDGVATESPPTTFEIIGNIQPLTASELTWMNKQDMSEAGQSREMFKLYSSTELLPLDETLNQKGDIVLFKDKKYEVQRIFNYQMDVLNHSKMILVKFPDQ